MRIASLSPFGLGYRKPHHYLEMLRVFWENRDNLGYAWNVLNHGVCDGCSLGPRGLKDDTLPGTHLCLTRLRLLRLNTMPAASEEVFRDVAALEKLDGRKLRNLGRLPYPMLRLRGEQGFRRVSWDEALDRSAAALRGTSPQRLAFFTTSRGLTNEVYYVAQKLARMLGTNHIDNAARLCHAASSTALKATLGIGASTVSYKDWLQCKFIALLGSNLANNQPVSLKYLYVAKKNGARIAVVNPYREPALERYWIPSIAKSALFGTRLMDDYFPVRVGGDVAFLNGALKYLIEWNALDRQFIRDHTSGWAELDRTLEDQRWPDLEAQAGVPRTEMERFAKIYAGAPSAIFIWSMGLTQHKHGVDNVKAVVNLALARGMLGKPSCGVVPIRGHSGVQGGGECGSVPDAFPGNLPVNPENARQFADWWGAPVPDWKGMHCGTMLEAAAEGSLDFFYVVGGNFIETMPDPGRMREALARVPYRVHQDILLNQSMLPDSGEWTLLLPGQTRYEQEGGGTQTSTERRIRFSPEIKGRHIGEAKAEWRILAEVGLRALDGPAQSAMNFTSTDQIRSEMDRVMPLYRGIAQLKAEGQSFQYGGERLLEGGICQNLPEGRARFSALSLPDLNANGDCFLLCTRRGAQFNSIVFRDHDALTGGRRDEVFMCTEDAARLGLAAGAPVVLESELGQMRARVRLDLVQPGTLQAFWPEANVLVARSYDPVSGEPDYNARVKVRRDGV
ncbi:MAG: FdhF/YdeP family oxidoreductase [Bryobacteraceae bacterium]